MGSAVPRRGLAPHLAPFCHPQGEKRGMLHVSVAGVLAKLGTSRSGLYTHGSSSPLVRQSASGAVVQPLRRTRARPAPRDRVLDPVAVLARPIFCEPPGGISGFATGRRLPRAGGSEHGAGRSAVHG